MPTYNELPHFLNVTHKKTFFLPLFSMDAHFYLRTTASSHAPVLNIPEQTSAEIHLYY